MGKIIIQFGKTMLPVIEKFTSNLKYLNTNDDCDIGCASQCFNPTASYNMFMDPDCMNECSCHFNGETTS